MKVKDLPAGAILWHNDAVLGVVGLTLPAMFDDCDCRKLPGNPFDFYLNPQSYNEEQKEFIDQATVEWGDDEEGF
jgi:hypothetical protein